MIYDLETLESESDWEEITSITSVGGSIASNAKFKVKLSIDSTKFLASVYIPNSKTKPTTDSPHLITSLRKESMFNQ